MITATLVSEAKHFNGCLQARPFFGNELELARKQGMAFCRALSGLSDTEAQKRFYDRLSMLEENSALALLFRQTEQTLLENQWENEQDWFNDSMF